jgi:hypothetical protein
VSPVALVHLVVVSPVTAAWVVLRVVPVLAVRWFSFVLEGFSSAMESAGVAPILNTLARRMSRRTIPTLKGAGGI